MMAEDLTAPLGLNRRARPLRPSLVQVGAALLALPFVVGLVWVAAVDDPLGGEPVAVAPLVPTRQGQTDLGGVVPPGRVVAGGPQIAATPGAQNDPKSLSATPLPGLVERTAHGLVPRIGPDGTRPLDAYRRPLAPGDAALPKIVVVVGGIGLSQTGTQEALRHLPGAATLGFAPAGAQLDRWLARAREAGHEILLQLPLEPLDFLGGDPGPFTLLVDQAPETRNDRLAFVLSRITNYAGVIAQSGSRFLGAEEATAPLVRDLASRGLLVMEDGTAPRSTAPDAARAARAPFLQADLVLDASGGEQTIDARLAELERIARAKGLAVGVASALPVSARRIGEWSKGLSARGIALVPASAAVLPDQQ